MALVRASPRFLSTIRLLGVCCLLGLPGLAFAEALVARPPIYLQREGEPLPEAPAALSDPSAEDLQLPADPAHAPELLFVSVAGGAEVIEASLEVQPVAPTAQQLTAPQPPPTSAPSVPSWVSSARETTLWAGPDGDSSFSNVPGGTTLRALERQADRFRVFYAGDRAKGISGGEAWVDAAEVSEAAWPAWVRLRSPADIVSAPSVGGAVLATLPRGAFLEVTGEARGNWAPVYFLGDGRTSEVEGWIEVGPVRPASNPELVSSFALRRDLLRGGGLDWLRIPYRSQLDGAPYAEANCGPTVANMVLESFGFKVPQADLRREVLSLQPEEDCDDCGVYIENLAEVIAWRGLTILRLRDPGSAAFHSWTQEEIRGELRAGRPVIAQVYYRRLPGRATSSYWGDHFIVLTGTLGERFVFNDPIDSDGPGYSRLIAPEALKVAMAESDYPYAAFAITRP